MNDVKRGDVWFLNLDPALGHEINKSRPGLIIQNDVGNAYSTLTIIAPITSQGLDKIYPIEVSVKAGNAGLEKDSKVLLNQIRAIDKRRLIHKIGEFDQETLRRVDDALEISLSLVRMD